MGNIYIYFGMLMGFCFLVVIPIVMILAPFGGKGKHRQTNAKDEEYRKLVENAIQTQQGMKDSQDKLIGEVSQLNKRMAAIEKILREVE